MERKVEIKDYEDKQHYLLVALNMVGIHMDYVTADLINSTLETLAEKGGNMDMLDAATIKSVHATKWDIYFNPPHSKKTKK
jgi:hypothetical protein